MWRKKMRNRKKEMVKLNIQFRINCLKKQKKNVKGKKLNLNISWKYQEVNKQ